LKIEFSQLYNLKHIAILALRLRHK